MWRDILTVVRYLLLHFAFWIIIFVFQRLLFIGVNSSLAMDTDITLLLASFAYGIVFDISIASYVALLICAVVALLGSFVRLRLLLSVCNVVSGVLAVIVMVLLPLNAYVYSLWGNHFDASSLHLLADISLAMASVTTLQIVVMLAVGIVLAVMTRLLQRLMMRKFFTGQETSKETSKKIWQRVLTSLVVLVIGTAMIIPIRGGLGIAPLNTGRAYFSQNLFANHTALNPLWNFIYSLKRVDATTIEYHFMETERAQRLFDEMMHREGKPLRVLKNERPNVIVVLLESFSAHGIKYLGGENVTPTIDSLLKESVAFSNIMALSDRSGKGLVATMCGYPTLPAMSIIQYPHKTQTLPIISQTLRKAGYDSQAFLYGGDLSFNNFNTLVTLGGFDEVITQDDFDSRAMSDKWGAHDEYVFDKLLEVIDHQEEPFFDFFFTLSSHEPFTVPMERQVEDDYLNSMYYTDKCLKDFIHKAKQTEWWNNTLLVLLADHGHSGPAHVGNTDRRRFNIPLIFTGGALDVRDTIFDNYGTQTDMAATLLGQLGLDSREYIFSKDLLNSQTEEFSFYDFNDGYGYINDSTYEVWDNISSTWLKREGVETDKGKAFLQMMSDDFHNR